MLLDNKDYDFGLVSQRIQFGLFLTHISGSINISQMKG